MGQRESGLIRNNFPRSEIDTWVGRVAGVEAVSFAGEEEWASRNNALAELGMDTDDFRAEVAPLIERFGATRVGVIVGTSTSSIGQTEEAFRQLEDGRFPVAYRQPLVHNPHSPGAYVAHRLGLRGPQLTISTACASSARVFASAWRWLQAGIVDAVVVGGVDSLCHSVLGGFASLELTSKSPCRPFDAERDGINLAEAAGLAIVLPAAAAPADAVRLAGYGETSDAFHMSQPAPGGEGALRAMRAAIGRAGISGAEIDYVNTHGTATKANDKAESEALAEVLGDDTLVSSTKGWTGHALGAAGILEAVIALDALTTGQVPGTLNLEHRDPDIAYPIIADNTASDVRHVMTNSFGFGGSNCSLVFARAA